MSLNQLSSNVGGFNFFRILECFSQCERIASGFSVPMGVGDECKISITKVHSSKAVTPSLRETMSKDIYSDSVELCETAASFLHSN